MVLFLHAAHWSYLVGSKWDCRGGVMLVAHPAGLKSQMIETLKIHERALILGDANVPSITRLRDDVAMGRYRTLGFTEFEKLYQRNPTTAINVEGHLRAFVDEGFRNPVWEDARMTTKKAFCMVIGAITPQAYMAHYSKWQDSGFGRRFIWMHYCLSDPDIITEAIHRWQRIRFPGLTMLQLDGEELAYNLTESESRLLRKMLEIDANTAYILLKKIAVVLKHATGKRFMEIIEDVAPCFKGEGGELVVERIFTDAGDSTYHHPKEGRTVPRGNVRSNRARTRRNSKTANQTLRPDALAEQRELSDVSESGLQRNRPQGSENDAKVKGASAE
jgi:hypothetical protein